jgi:recombination associated protein RdgC
MWFKNLVLLRLQEPFTLDAAAFEAHLKARAFTACGVLESFSDGWCSPIPLEHAPLVHQGGNDFLFCLKREERILPSGAVNEQVQERIAEVESREARSLRKKEREAVRDEVLQDMMPRAFTQSRRTYGYLDTRNGWLVVDAASPKKAEDFVAVLRQTLDGFPVRPIAPIEPPPGVMTRWVAGGLLPEEVILESECELKSPEEDGSIVRCRRQDLDAPEIRHHIEAGKEVIKLAFSWNDRFSLVLDEHLTIRRLRFLDTLQEARAEVASEDVAAQFDGDFAIMRLEIAAFIPVLLNWFGGEKKPQAA